MDTFGVVRKFACRLGCMQEAKCTRSTMTEDKGGLGVRGVADELLCLAANAVGHMGTLVCTQDCPNFDQGLAAEPSSTV